MKCKECDGTGSNKETKKLRDDWYSFGEVEWICAGPRRRYNNKAWQYHLIQEEVKALLDAGRLMDFTRVPINDEQKSIVEKKIADGGNSWLPFDNGYIPTAEEVNEWATIGMGHDAINQSICVRARAERLGVYGVCPVCNGSGELWLSDEIKKLHEEWKPCEPPTGEGYQLWETTSEGSPNSPVFKTLEELCEWCETNTNTFARFKATKEQWMQMLSDDFVCHQEGNVVFI